MKARVLIDVSAGDVHIDQDMHKLPRAMQAAIVSALQSRLGLRMEHLHKAHEHPQVHPLYPELRTLIEAARRSWARHGEELVRRVMKLREEGRLLPLNEHNEALLRDLFADHQVGVLADIVGFHPDTSRVNRLVRQGLVDPDYASTAPVTVSFKLGRGLEALAVPDTSTERSTALADILKRSHTVRLTKADEAGLRYVRQRGAQYMRVTVEKAQGNVARQLHAEEVARIRGAVHGAMGAGGGQREVRAALTDAVVGTEITNDLDRVTRTEVASAQVWGAFESLRDEAAKLGDQDPLIYRIPDPNACKHCLRIYGNGRDAIPYRLSYVQQRTLSGGNFGLRAAEWGPVAEATHPNCACSNWFLYDEAMVDEVQDAVDWISKHLG